ncbi:DEAD/DEAH box helicase [Chryseobacterium culicis]|uniref:DEAD/DEAH box helicase n=1 Tax=Chryseobacterium culicis TaxID=680127 RepID=UPI002898B6CD|nr:DEAD/DEAH box helicase [Chryseobacterium culicis]
MDTFSRYSSFIREYIYQNGWNQLRAIQAAAGDAIFNTDENVLLSASTASGKTEAAFFPIITLMQEDPPTSIGCLYIAPLKALINDQFIRLNDICEESGISVWHWHGDVSQSRKKKMMRHPSGILQITPESLEAMLLHRHSQIPHLFGDLRFVVIDEVHSFLRGDRGGQTLCLIERLSRLAGVNPRRIGLSATVGDTRLVGEYLSAGTGKGAVIPRIHSGGMQWHLSMQHFFTTGEQAYEKTDNVARAVDAPEAPTDVAPQNADPGIAYIFEHTRGHKCLVFSNSREECEVVTATLRQYCEVKHEPDRFLIHHGNLSVSYRQNAEDLIKQDDSLITVCTTSTLELGIDIGRLERAFQIDAPFTVSSFLQRMGRTGRRNAPSEMWFVIREEHPEARALLPETIPWKLLQGIALIQLYLEERWVEPPRAGRLPYSLLYHQTMSTLASGGEMTPAELASRVLSLDYFRLITADDFKVLLLHLISIDHLNRTENGGLILGLAGERIVNNFKFYAVFQENEEYSVRFESEELGTIVKPPPLNDKIAIAGRVWVVEEVDRNSHVVYCHPVKGIVPAYFGDEPGDIHTKILERMQRLLQQDETYPYLLKNAVSRLVKARDIAERSALDRKPLISLGGKMYGLFPWLGSYAFLALERFLRIKCGPALGLKGFDSKRPYYIQFSMNVSEQDFYRIVEEEIKKDIDPMTLLYPKEAPIFDKYDDILPEELTRKGFAFGVLNLEEMKQRVMSWTKT